MHPPYDRPVGRRPNNSGHAATGIVFTWLGVETSFTCLAGVAPFASASQPRLSVLILRRNLHRPTRNPDCQTAYRRRDAGKSPASIAKDALLPAINDRVSAWKH
jgi:hypothetical protein